MKIRYIFYSVELDGGYYRGWVLNLTNFYGLRGDMAYLDDYVLTII